MPSALYTCKRGLSPLNQAMLVLLIAMLVAADDGLPIPTGPEPAPIDVPHFPRKVDVFVFRNWGLAPLQRIAETLGADVENVRELATAMGLEREPQVSDDLVRRSALTVIRRNWHLLPYEQLLQLLGWSEGKLGYVLREDDFLWIKLGSLKPKCERLRLTEPDLATRERHAEIRAVVEELKRNRTTQGPEKPFDFLKRFQREDSPAAPSTPPAARSSEDPQERPRFALRFLHSYFALYGDALLEPGLDPYPDPYLAQLARSGVNGVWLPVLLRSMTPPAVDHAADGHAARLSALAGLVERAKQHGIRVYLYLNEPRAMPLSYFQGRENLRGVTEGDAAALCMSVHEVRQSIVESVKQICARAPDLGGFFTITASENLTHCWSHHRGAECPRCKARSGAEVVADVNRAVLEGVRAAGSRARVIAWDWGWRDEWIEPAIAALPDGCSVMSVSEWSLPIERGGIKSLVGEYSLSSVGPGPRAERTWKLAKARGLEVIAKVQAGCTWELSSVPYIPVVKLAAEHARRLAERGVDGVLLGWTLGGCPSPNLEAFARYAFASASAPLPKVSEVLRDIASRRCGTDNAETVAQAWEILSEAFRDFPFDGGVVYRAPLQLGPANLLHANRTGYASTMVGLPYDDLDGWRSIYPREVFAELLERVAKGFAHGCDLLDAPPAPADASSSSVADRAAVEAERIIAKASQLHFQSVAAQARFVMARDALAEALQSGQKGSAGSRLEEIERIAISEETSATELLGLVAKDSRLGFEASNQYYYLPVDLIEKVLNTRWLRQTWIPRQRSRL